MFGGSTYSMQALRDHFFVGVAKPKAESRTPRPESHQVRS
jgi:hypothetical protein